MGGGEAGGQSSEGTVIKTLRWPQRVDRVGVSSSLHTLTVSVCIGLKSFFPKMHFYFKGKSWAGFRSLLGSEGSWLGLLPECV